MSLSRYRRAASLLAVLTLGVLLGALVASRWIRSPQQELLDRSAPPLTTLSAKVERRVVQSTVIVRAQVRPQRSVDVVPAASAGTTALVSAVKVRPGQRVSAGQVLVEVAGRPIIVLPGSVPAYRDLLPGDSGRDVRQLQTSLRALGIAGVPMDGVFGATTKAAVARLYARAGYDPVIHGDPATLQSAHAQVVSARRAVTDAQVTLSRARADLKAAGSAPKTALVNAVADARRQLGYAQADLQVAVAAEQETQRTSGAELPQAEVVFVPSLPARVQSVKAAVGAAVTTPLLTLSSGPLVAVGRLSLSQHDAVRVGMATQLISDVNAATLDGRVASVGQLVQQQDTGDAGYPVTVTVGTGIPAGWTGQDVRLSVRSAGSDGPVLAVPFSAVFAGADGSAHVLKVVSGGNRVSVAVTTGTSGDGYVEIGPVDGALAPGDEVVVGQGRNVDGAGGTGPAGTEPGTATGPPGTAASRQGRR